MDKNHHDESTLFLMRLWGEDTSSVATETNTDLAGTNSAVQPRWRGKLLHVVTGEAQYFSDWPALLSILQSMFPEGVDTRNEHTSFINRQDQYQ
jgi:hypothetical protein